MRPAAIAIATHRSMLPRLLAQRAVRLRPHAMVERRRIYLPLRALFMLNRCFI
jgi:hypothetical protein